MSIETSKSLDLGLLGLQKQREIVARWLACPTLPADSRTQLMEMLTQVEWELQKLEAKQASEQGPEKFKQAV